jgi:hypothetical protein
VLILVPLYQSTLPPLFFTLFCSFSFNQSSSAFLPILQRSSSITSPQPRLSNSIYLVFFPPPPRLPHSFPPQDGPRILTGTQEHFQQHLSIFPHYLCPQQSCYFGLAFSRTSSGLIIHHGGPQEHYALQPSDRASVACHIHPHHPPN